ncbi:hypothetical protein E4K67_17445 [Desulfosporosinus fructosivorans]|uniref:Phage tail protein n=1 Tax=Desulfosporosinus fructosivorans TaxID=2018669 RepID=A0A4Z0R2Q2_9FIRM|nr:phage tail protein [Desulfosporosinus fructosivorans]TGE36884.1 hypothetical protein E4K67_17445 [Desulfosporosinus fructosivorans]
MANREIFVDTRQVNRLTIELRGFEARVGVATYHALQRTIDQTITQVGRIVPRAYAIKAKEVKESFAGGIKRPTSSNLTASITSKGHTLSLAHFPFTPRAPGGSRRRGKVAVTIKKSGGKKVVNTNPLPFVATTGARSADLTQFNVFRREGRARFPITVPRTLSIPQMITNENVGEQIQEFATEKLNARLEHEITRAMTSMSDSIRRGN